MFKSLRDMRSKDWVLKGMHYKEKSNQGFLQGNQLWMQTYINDTYHWKLELLKLLGVEPPTVLVSACKLENETRVKIHDKQQTDAYKRNRYKLKGKRLAVNEQRKVLAAKHKADLLEYLPAGTMLFDEEMTLDETAMDELGEGTEGEFIGHEALLQDLQARTQEAAGHRQRIQEQLAPAGGAPAGAAGDGATRAALEQPKTKAKPDKGQAGACKCGATCQKGCPCRGASPPVDCTANCHPGNSKCKNCDAGRAAAATAEAHVPVPAGPGAKRRPVPSTISWKQGAPLVERSPLPERCLGLVLSFEATGGVACSDEITHGCLRVVVLTTVAGSVPVVTKVQVSDDLPSEVLEVFEHVNTSRFISPHLVEASGIQPASNPESVLVGKPAFADANGFGQRCMLQLRALARTKLPIVLIGHRIIEFDLVLLFSAFERLDTDVYALWRDCGVVGVIDTLALAKTHAWSHVPLDSTRKESFALGPVHEALTHEGLGDAYDVARAVSAASVVLPLLLTTATQCSSCVVGIDEAVCRMRVLRVAHLTAAAPVREIVEVRESVQYFVMRARDGASFVFPTPIRAAARQAVRSEAGRLGIRSEAVESGEGPSVRVINLPTMAAVCATDAAAEALTTELREANDA